MSSMMAAKLGKEKRVDLALPVSAVLEYSDRIIINAEKCRLEPYQDPPLPTTLGPKRPPNSLLAALDDCRRSCTVDNIQRHLRDFQYRQHEDTIQQDLKNLSESITNKHEDMSGSEIPKVASPVSSHVTVRDSDATRNRGDNQGTNLSSESLRRVPSMDEGPVPIKPTTLLQRAIERHRLKKIQSLPVKDFGNVDIITLADGGTQLKLQLLVKQSRGTSLKSKSSGSQKSEVPVLRYEHDDGKSRNLPGQPELIRLLFETEFGFNSHSGARENTDSNRFLELYGNAGPPLVEGIKRKAKRRRKTVCKFCGKQPGCHQKWCVYYEAEPVVDYDSFDLKRPSTRSESKTSKSEERTSSLERSHTTIEPRQSVRPDLPDYSSLHRDVYTHALAASRAKRALGGARDFANQSTRPFTFSYFGLDKCNKASKNEMENIFGKENVDFTEYYDLFVKERQNTM